MMAKYKMTQEEYNILLREYKRLGQMLENVEIVKKPIPLEPHMIDMFGRLDAGTMQRLFGKNADNIWYYNFDAGKWCANGLLENGFFHVRYNTTNVKVFKRVIEEENKNIEVAACVVMPVEGDGSAIETGAIVKKPRFCFGGLGAVATLVCRDKATKQFMKPFDWIWVDLYSSKYQCMQAAMSRFAVEGARNYYFRQTLLGKRR